METLSDMQVGDLVAIKSPQSGVTYCRVDDFGPIVFEYELYGSHEIEFRDKIIENLSSSHRVEILDMILYKLTLI